MVNFIFFILRPLMALISTEEPSARFHCGLMVLSALRYDRNPPFHVNLPSAKGEYPCLNMYCSICGRADNFPSHIVCDDCAESFNFPLYLS